MLLDRRQPVIVIRAPIGILVVGLVYIAFVLYPHGDVSAAPRPARAMHSIAGRILTKYAPLPVFLATSCGPGLQRSSYKFVWGL